jgi:hypothetical protein
MLARIAKAIGADAGSLALLSHIEKKIDAIVECRSQGGGNRGWLYAQYARTNPAEMRIVGLAEPIPIRRSTRRTGQQERGNKCRRQIPQPELWIRFARQPSNFLSLQLPCWHSPNKPHSRYPFRWLPK